MVIEWDVRVERSSGTVEWDGSSGTVEWDGRVRRFEWDGRLRRSSGTVVLDGRVEPSRVHAAHEVSMCV